MFEKDEFPIFAIASLHEIAKSHTLRCDSKQFENRFRNLEALLDSQEWVYLGEFLPKPLVKGSQPTYLDEPTGIPVISTLSIQDLSIHETDCRHIAEEDFVALSDDKKLRIGDVLLTMDGGTSIGKSVLFDLEGDWTTDSHVAILRPEGISPEALVYLLASPLGQIQFQKAESGASGQTAVTEEDLRRFRFPQSALERIDSLTAKLDAKRTEIREKIFELQSAEKAAWDDFIRGML